MRLVVLFSSLKEDARGSGELSSSSLKEILVGVGRIVVEQTVCVGSGLGWNACVSWAWLDELDIGEIFRASTG